MDEAVDKTIPVDEAVDRAIPMDEAVDRAIAALAARQHGYVTRPQLLEFGLGRGRSRIESAWAG